MATRHDTTRRTIVVLLLLLAVLTTGCAPRPAVAPAPATPTPAATSAAPTSSPAPTVEPARVVRADGPLSVHDAPRTAPTRSLPATTSFGTPTVALVTEVGRGADDGWLEVLLPVRPNGSTGWVREADVEVHEVSLAVHVDLEARELVVVDGEDEVLRTPAAIGDADHPTPTGRFYVTDKLETPDPDGAYGPYALGLSARSDVLTQFAGGDGQVGIHGTNAPGTIGQAVSHGCLRVPDEIVRELAHLLPLGTPVIIA